MAVKQIVFQSLKVFQNVRKSIMYEMNVFRLLHHDNIINYYGTEVHRDKMFIFMEYCPLSLHDLLEQRGRIPEIIVKEIANQILNGLAYLHERDIVHRDIKPRNILVGQDKKLKIADFGSSKFKENALRDGIQSGTFIGTPHYMAPEGCFKLSLKSW